MTFYYLDTCIWRDFYENRVSKTGQNLGKYATILFLKIIQNHDKILFSDFLIKELKRDYDELEVGDMLGVLFMTGVLVKISIEQEEFYEAEKLAHERNLPFVDCISAVQARNHNAIMVSQDKHFIVNLSDITNTVRPQELI